MRNMIECPWCNNQVILQENICPECKQEVLPEHLNSIPDNSDQETENIEENYSELNVEQIISNRFICSKCRHNECHIKEVAMSGTGLSKIFDIEHNHFLFVSCMNCGFVEIYNPDILHGKKSGSLGTILDILFGG
jgi:predicted nucleic-acid-binding Zn-ribbon protein